MPAPEFSTCLWFDREAEEAASLYASIFANARIGSISRYAKGMPMPEGLALTVELELPGHKLLLLNGGPMFRLSEAVSVMVECDTQAQIDDYWERLSEGGAKSRCGWLKDRYGLFWQVVPRQIKEWMRCGDADRIGAMFRSLMTMDKLDIATLEAAFEGRGRA